MFKLKDNKYYLSNDFIMKTKDIKKVYEKLSDVFESKT